MSSSNVISVSVTVNGSTISCSPDPVKVTCSNAKLSYSLPAGGDWIFPATGAVVVSDPGTQFPVKCKRINDYEVHLHDCNSVSGSYKYTVTVKNRVTGAQLVKDPTISNDPPPTSPARAKKAVAAV